MSLSEKISQVKDEHAEEQFQKLQQKLTDSAALNAMYVLGRIKQTGHLAGAIFSNLAAQEIRALEYFQKEKLHEALGFDTFNDFLDESEYAPVTKRQYYDRLAL